MASWLTSGNEESDRDDLDLDSDRYFFGESSLPKIKESRKRSSASAGLQDDSFVEEFERKLKLTPSALERLKVADELLKDPDFVLMFMRSLPEFCVRNLAATCSQWQGLAYKTLRDRRGNNAFSVLWIDDDNDGGVDAGSYDEQTYEFDFNMFFHKAYLGGYFDGYPTQLKATRKGMPLEAIQGSCANVICQNRDDSTDKMQVESTGKVEFILTYGSANMECRFMGVQDENKTLKSAACRLSTLLILSSSVLVTTPDYSQVVEAVGSTESNRKLMSSVMFPESAHVLFECFVVPSGPVEAASACISNVVGTPTSTIKPKALLLYQYLNLIDSKPGIVEVLHSLKMTQGSTGFPMVTGIYNYLDASLNTQDEGCEGFNDVVASGLLICGDDFCNVSVISVNLLNTDDLELNLTKIKSFYSADTFTTKYALLFYHNEVTKPDSKGSILLDNYLDNFRRELRNVHLHGIGSLSGAHAMLVNPDSDLTFNQLNQRMMGLTGTIESKTSPDSMELILVLLSYSPDGEKQLLTY